jgi:hypothetical protein
MNSEDPWEGLPGAELVRQGLSDLASGVKSEFSLLMAVAITRLEPLGVRIDLPPDFQKFPPEHVLYEFLEEHHGLDAHSRYNSLLRRLNSFAHALEREESRALADKLRASSPPG